MKALKHLAYLLLVVPFVLIVTSITYCSATAEVVEQYGILWKVTVTEADGSVYKEAYEYDAFHTMVTIEYYENDELIRTEEREIVENDPLLYDTFEVLPHPTATAAKTEREEDGSNVTLRYFDSDGNPEGYSELIYSAWNRLAQQKDFDTSGNLLRTTLRECVGATVTAAPPIFDELEAIAATATTAPTA